MTTDRHDNRQPTADLLKGTAVLLMIQVHVLELFVRQDVMDSLPGKVMLFLGGPPVAPVFLAVMGFYARQASVAMTVLLQRGARLLMLGILLNLGLNAHLLWRIQLGELALDPWEYVFGVDILFSAGLGLMVLALLRPVFSTRGWLWAIAALLVASLTPSITGLLTTDSAWRWVGAYLGSPVRWSYFPLFPWLGYVLAGAAASCLHQPLAFSGRQRWLILLAGAPLLAFLGKDAFEVSGDLPRYYHHGAAFFVWTCAFMVVWGLLHQCLAERVGSGSRWGWLGRQVTVFYVVQWLLIGNIATALYKTESLLHGLLWVVTLTVLTGVAVGMYEKLHGRRRANES